MSLVAVIGAGYVGLTSAACLAELGHHVLCADILPEKVAALSRGEVPILEDGLGELVREGLAGGRLSFVLGASAAAAGCEFAFSAFRPLSNPMGQLICRMSLASLRRSDPC